jgi:hypothetical protein
MPSQIIVEAKTKSPAESLCINNNQQPTSYHYSGNQYPGQLGRNSMAFLPIWKPS